MNDGKRASFRNLRKPVRLLDVECERYDEFQRNVPSHVEDTHSACHVVRVSIFQSRQVVLICAVEDVGNGKV